MIGCLREGIIARSKVKSGNVISVDTCIRRMVDHSFRCLTQWETGVSRIGSRPQTRRHRPTDDDHWYILAAIRRHLLRHAAF